MIRIDAKPLYKVACKASRDAREYNDCAVIVVSNACDVPYEQAHESLEMNGRKPRRATFVPSIIAAVKLLGGAIVKRTWFYRCDDFIDKKPGDKVSNERDGQIYENVWMKNRVTANTITQHVDPKKRYLAMTRGHIFAIINGEVMDWQAGRRFVIEELYEISGA